MAKLEGVVGQQSGYSTDVHSQDCHLIFHGALRPATYLQLFIPLPGDENKKLELATLAPQQKDLFGRKSIKR